MAILPADRPIGYWQVETTKDFTNSEWSLIRYEVEEATRRGKALIVAHGFTLRWHPVPDSLDAAWAEAEAAKPEGWRFQSLAPGMYDGDNEPARIQWFAAATPTPWHDSLGPYLGSDYASIEERGETPAAALRALAAKLRDHRRSISGEPVTS